MRLVLEMELDNAYFADDEGPDGLSRRAIGNLLREAGRDLQDLEGSNETEGAITDPNGNTVGRWRIDEAE